MSPEPLASPPPAQEGATDGAPAIGPELSRASAARHVTDVFVRRGIDRSDARFLVRHALGLTATDLVLRGAEPIGREGAAALETALGRRLSGEPVARIAGAWDFWGLTFSLSPATLIPRPDTETLVETALRRASDRERPIRLLDLGTGSGCILTALLSERPRAVGIGIDRSAEALVTARTNARRNGVAARALFVQADWCAGIRGPFDLIVSNPPYIASTAIPTLADEVRLHDPVAALDGGTDGLDAYRAILGGVAEKGLLAEDGALLLETGHDQAAAVARLGIELGFRDIDVARDLAGHERVVTLRPSSPVNISA